MQILKYSYDDFNSLKKYIIKFIISLNNTKLTCKWNWFTREEWISSVFRWTWANWHMINGSTNGFYTTCPRARVYTLKANTGQRQTTVKIRFTFTFTSTIWISEETILTTTSWYLVLVDAFSIWSTWAGETWVDYFWRSLCCY